MNAEEKKIMEAIIEISAVSKSYSQNGQNVFALHDIHLSVAERDIYGIIVLSGAVKSTLMR